MATFTISLSDELLARVKQLEGAVNWSEVAGTAIASEIEAIDKISELRKEGADVEIRRELIRIVLAKKFKKEEYPIWVEAGAKFALKYANYEMLLNIIQKCEGDPDHIELMRDATGHLDGNERQDVFDGLVTYENLGEEMKHLAAKAFLDGAYGIAKKINEGF